MTSYIIQKLNIITGEWFPVTVRFRYYTQAAEHMSDLREGNEHAKYRMVSQVIETTILSI